MTEPTSKSFLPVQKRMIYGNLIILMGTMGAIGMSFIYSWFINKFPLQETRFNYIFGISGGILALSTIVSSLLVYTNNLGDGFKQYGKK